jgi:hypothetical protein
MRAGLALALLLAGATAASAGVVSSLDLAKPFATRTPWRLTATQGPEVEAIVEGKEPGAIALCISNDDGRSCRPDLNQAPRRADDLFSEPHYLEAAEIVHPRADLALLLLRTSSLHSGDGDQRGVTRLLAYDHGLDRFVPVYEHSANRNNNQEIRYVRAGPLKGAVIRAEPTENGPFAYWITVSTLAGRDYEPVLRYRSATRYGDGNPLSVIDSEMANMLQRLGLWHAGLPLPRPARPCPRPRLIGMELWCS